MIEKLLLVVSVTTLCMLSPGPDMVLVVRNTLVMGRRQGGITAVGVLTGNLFHIGYCALGVAVLLQRSPAAYNVLRVASAVYLLYLGIQSLRATESGKVHADRAGTGTRSTYWQGLFNNLLNPKGSLFYLGVFTQLITPDMSALQAIALVGVMVTVSAVFWVAFVHALHIPPVRNWFARSSVTISRAFGLVLILFAIRVATLHDIH